MQIVIEITEEGYKWVCDHVNMGYNLFKMIANGTPLPKEHGRLIDADILKKDDEVTEWLSLNAVRTGKMLKSFSELFIKKIDATPTIIETDKGDKE